MDGCYPRAGTRAVTVGGVTIGGGAPIVVQGMAKCDTRDVGATAAQIERMVEAGCEAARVAVPDADAVRALAEIRRRVAVPLVADIHFDYRLALGALEAGVDKLRLNPGNIGSRERVSIVARAARERRVPIRVGANSGSVDRELLDRHGGPTPPALVESALRQVAVLEHEGFNDIVISVKSSSVPDTIAAYRELASKVDYPLHLGITESGPGLRGAIKSSVGLGVLLAGGIGDTLRVSLTADPVEEVRVAYEILGSLGLRRRGPEIISCPTCGRCEVELAPVVEEIEKRASKLSAPISIAIMGCTVNGPGEARGADVGLAAGGGVALIFRGGKIVEKVREGAMLESLWREILDVAGRRGAAGPS